MISEMLRMSRNTMKILNLYTSHLVWAVREFAVLLANRHTTVTARPVLLTWQFEGRQISGYAYKTNEKQHVCEKTVFSRICCFSLVS